MRVLITFVLLSLWISANAQQPVAAVLTTPRGTSYPAFQRDVEPMTAAQIEAIKQECKVNYSKAVQVSPASAKYNCHSYAWYSQSSSTNKYWLNSPSDDAHWLDGSFTCVNTVTAATKWSYWVGDHSATTYPLGQAVKFRSKWGAWPLMDHNWNYSPYNSTTMIGFENCSSAANTCKASAHVSATAISKTSVKLTWTRACNAKSYVLEYQVGASTTWNTLSPMTAPTGAYLSLVMSLTTAANTCYKFRIKTVNGTASATSATVSVCTSALSKVPKEEEWMQKYVVAIPEFHLANPQPTPIASVSKDLNVYPNPTTNELVVERKAEVTEKCMIRMMDVQGKIVLEKTWDVVEGNNKLILNVAHLQNGFYLIQMGELTQKIQIIK